MTDHDTITARFAVTGWEPADLTGLAEPPQPPQAPVDWVGAIVMRKAYSAGLVGSSVAHFVSSGDEQSRGYLAVERITGTLDDGRSGSVTVHHGALQHPDDSSAFGYIVPGTGTVDFAGFRGQARILQDDDGPYFVITLEH
ncbi:DUF3224 domain-containing protein [Herbiconiux daphne]|uniref:DUF3224 domain-containing protein n=1 Tax=Herbiconiux daphne TaxID=2970914 RepID=A0ABT2H140_9MICO|nr:DUF3224 domain-containing protein [Herbiconiux daphne]MCS5733650.1 DUF3224 domain-containing protein [Herbiconiux daphne]